MKGGRTRPFAVVFYPIAAALLMVATLGLAATPAGAAGAHLTGGGSGFAGPEIDQWKAETAVAPYNLSINYVAQGSTFGRVSFYSQTLDFGASDITYPPFELDALKASRRCAGKTLHDCFVYVPVSAGGVAFMYNLVDGSGNRVSNLQLTRRAACKIFTGAITKWNDPELVQSNPFLRNFARGIQPVVRADGAGESYVLSEFCIAVAPDVWRDFIARQRQENPQNNAADFLSGSPVSNWPPPSNANAVPYADGVANAVADPSGGPGSMTYVAAAYAKQRSFPVASLQNAAGMYTQPDEANVTVALGYARPNPSADAAGTFLLNFSGGDPRAYFPSTYSYILAQRAGFNPAQGATLGVFLCYAISAGQAAAVPLRYARLSAPIVNIAIDAISNIPGAPDKNHCVVAGSAPPPPPPAVNGGTGFPTGPGPSGGPPAANANSNPSAGGPVGNGRATTTTTVKGQKSTATTVVGSSGRDPGGTTTDSSIAQENIDLKLASAADHARTESKSISGIWVLVAGVAVAWLFSFMASKRRTST